MQAVVNINITDVNDNHPIFQTPAGGYEASIPEDTEIGFEVITVLATDIDQESNMITYAISNTNVPFTIDPLVSYYCNICVCRVVI